jgi:hypothetical protein
MQTRAKENSEVNPELKMIPKFQVEFKMKLFSFNMINKDNSGVFLSTNYLRVQTRMYDGKNYLNENFFEMGL